MKLQSRVGSQAASSLRSWIRGAGIGLLVMLAAWGGLLDPIDRWGLEALFALRGDRVSQSPIIIVSIAEDSFDELNLAWPWPRALHADLLNRISQGHPAAVGFDVAFPEPSLRGAEDDQALAEALGRAGNVILAAPITIVQETAYVKEDVNAPIRPLREQAAGFGYVNFVLDDDAAVRSAEISRQFQDREIPSFTLALYRAGVKTGLRAEPITERSFLINYRGGPHSFPTIPYYRILNGEVGPETFAGKIVLVGATSPVLHDVYPTPTASHGDLAGVEIQANVLETLVQGIPLQRVPRGVSVGLACLAAVLAVWLTNRFTPLAALGTSLIVALLYGIAAFAVFVWGRTVLDVSAVVPPLLLGYGATVVENFIAEKRQRATLMQLFSRHVSPEIAEAIWQQRELFLSGGRLRSQKITATVLFTDLKGFTSISESMDTPSLLDWINDYMEVMAQLVMKHGGVVDDYFGDAIKANFGVPFRRATESEIAQDAINAVACALAMAEELKRLNRSWQERGLPIVGMRAGIFTGEVVAGCVGSAQRMKYTTIGDTVNTASRLESFEKDRDDPHGSLGSCRILVGELTRSLLGGRYRTQPVGELSLKGKAKTIAVYLVCRSEDAEPIHSEGVELRKAARVNIAGRATVSNGFRADAFVGNLSVGGLAVSQLPQQVAIGKSARLTFELPGMQVPIQADGIVMWAAHDRAGFAFRDMSQDDRAKVEEFVAQQR